MVCSCVCPLSVSVWSIFSSTVTCVYETGDLDYSSVLLGMLVMQDVQLGLFIAVMPTLIQAQSGDLGGSVLLFGPLLFPLPYKHILNLFFVVFCCEMQPAVWQPSHPTPPGSGAALSGCCAAAVFVTEILPDRSVLQESAC